MGIDKNWANIHITYQFHPLFIVLPILTGSSLRITPIAKQHIKDIKVMQINCMLSGQMFAYAGGISSLC